MKLFVAVLLALFGSALTFGQDCSVSSVGFVPLTDLMDGTHKGSQGGLYPGGVNHRPPAHDLAGLQQAAQVVPLDSAGHPDPAGKVVMISIGMSHTMAETLGFLSLLASDPALHPSLEIHNGAQSGVSVELMDDPADAYWTVLPSLLASSGVSVEQVQVIWLKQTKGGPSGPFPQWAENLRDQLRSVVQIAKATFPNLRLGYLTPRSYAGYATSALNPEPYAYETGFADKWLIEDQINGDPQLNFDPAAGPVLAPWLAYGPYIWADGLIPRSDGLTYPCDLYDTDGTHMTTAGWLVVAEQLVDFFKTDATTKSWFLANPGTTCVGQAEVQKYGTGVGGLNGTAQLVASVLPTAPTAAELRLFGFEAPAGALGGIGWGLGAFVDGQIPFLGGWLLVDPLQSTSFVTDANGHLALSFGPMPDDPAFCGVEIFAQLAVQDSDSPAGWDVSRGLRLRLGH